MEEDPGKAATSFAKKQQSVKRRKINPTNNNMGSNDAVVDPPSLVARDSLETVTTPKTDKNNDTSQPEEMATAASFDNDQYSSSSNRSSSSSDEGENSRLDVMEGGDDSSDQYDDEYYFLESAEEKPGDLDLGRSLFLRQPISESEVPSVEVKVKDNLVKSVDLLEEQGYEAYRQWKTKITAKDEAKTKAEQKTMEEALEDAKIEGQPRHYQQQLFEIACTQNTIVNLGTGAGKTLIGLMVIRHFAPSFQEGKQVLFMVPSVALAIQQSTTLRANLPYSVKVACYSTCTSIKARKELQKCKIIVATHGALNDLLMHYGDMFSMSGFSLLVLDECHYANAGHQYSTMMKRFFHTLPVEKRPHVLGLTASPLVKAKPNHTEENFLEMLQTLEETLSAKVVTYSGVNDSLTNSSLMRKAADEREVKYSPFNPVASLPSIESMKLHRTREREFQQLYQLYNDLGPLVVSIYCDRLRQEISRNAFEKESGEDFKELLDNFSRIAELCDHLSQNCPFGGRSDKLMALEELLEEQIEVNGGPETVGLVFVERRITALALMKYFHFRDSQIKKNNWNFASEARNRSPGLRMGNFSAPPAISRTVKTPYPPPDFPPLERASSQFDDAEDDIFDVSTIPQPIIVGTTPKHSSSPSQSNFVDADDPFADAEEEDDSLFEEYLSRLRYGSAIDQGVDHGDQIVGSQPIARGQPSARAESIRCQALVRNSTQIFKSLNMSRRFDFIENEEMKKAWLHQEYKIREVLGKLRRGEINVLIATNVVEEGVDVQACSFVAAFDSLRSTKGYIQMKGRARKKDAKFFVFRNVEDKESTKSSLNLESAQDIERRVSQFIASRSHIRSLPTPKVEMREAKPMADVDNEELLAVDMGVYMSGASTVDLNSAKSLVNRYVLSLPIDPIARTTKELLLSHLPKYTEKELILPSHLDLDIRVITLPECYASLGSKEKQKVLALMACVRLHKNSLLSDRLLPLTRSDLQQKILEQATEEPRRIPTNNFRGASDFRRLIVYPFRQENRRIEKLHKTLRSKGHSLAIITTEYLGEIPPMRVAHELFGGVTCSLGEPFVSECNEEQLQLILRFFKLMMDCRWRRRSKGVFFRPKSLDDLTQLIPPYFVGCLSKEGEIDWAEMTKLVDQSKRSEYERTVAAQAHDPSIDGPRLVAPLYDPAVTYIMYGPSEETCASPFPSEREGVVTFQDYFGLCRGYDVEEDCPLMDAQRLFSLPFRKVDTVANHEDENFITKKPVFCDHSTLHEVCEDLHSVKLPETACMEAVMADPNFLLLCLHLPQWLATHLRPYVTTKSFIGHCNQHLPRLGMCLSKFPLEKVTEALTAKSCSEECSYEKLEWFGDAVLKLVQTDSLLQSKLSPNLHEGELSTLRSVMGCNDRLELACKNLKIDQFILTSPLGRGQWSPATLELYKPAVPGVDSGTGVTVKSAVPGKTCADVIESILGLIYSVSYEEATSVAEELQITLPKEEVPRVKPEPKIPPKAHLVNTATNFTGHTKFRRYDLIEEAFTHPTAVHPSTPSYQRLEWIGDAVLCLAIRKWIFDTFPTADLGQMVAMEASLVANETLSFLSIKHGLLRNLNHCDQTLPSRIEHYEWCTRDLGRGLWGTDPPKVAADVVEALIGAVYLDSGLADGIMASIHILTPMLKVLEIIFVQGDNLIMMHPKKTMQEFGGRLLIMNVMKEEEFASTNHGVPVWLGNRWGEASSAGDKFIGYVHCLDSIVVAVADVSSEVAGNRACAFVVSMLRADPDLLDRIQESRRSIESSCSREANLSESEFFYASSGEMYLVKADIEGKDSSKKVTVESSKTKNANGQGETKALMPNSNSQLEENSSKAAEVATMDSVIEAMVNNVLN